jgi:hypothetical protein
MSAKLFELRVYSMVPELFPKYLQLTNEFLHIRVKHSTLCGFWLTEIGGQNEVVHVWEYNTFEHRKAVRDALAADEEWKNLYLAHVRGCWREQQNWLMRLDSGTQVEALKARGYLLELSNRPSGASGQSFTVVTGTGCFRKVTLRGSNNLDELVPTGANAPSSDIQVDSRIMYPAPWSERLGCCWR